MKKLIAALALTAAIATPAMAQTYLPSDAPYYSAPARMGYGASAYSPDVTGFPPSAMGPVVWHNGRYVGADPDPSVRRQLGIDADNIVNR